ncbi:hypothetical protein B0H19DRAFT_82889 [Mycena capillaripes]|nr:hypothetical protein B0H19DRAFT_82889 [Mycena capillaripes]
MNSSGCAYSLYVWLRRYSTFSPSDLINIGEVSSGSTPLKHASTYSTCSGHSCTATVHNSFLAVHRLSQVLCTSVIWNVAHGSCRPDAILVLTFMQLECGCTVSSHVRLHSCDVCPCIFSTNSCSASAWTRSSTAGSPATLRPAHAHQLIVSFEVRQY